MDNRNISCGKYSSKFKNVGDFNETSSVLDFRPTCSSSVALLQPCKQLEYSENLILLEPAHVAGTYRGAAEVAGTTNFGGCLRARSVVRLSAPVHQVDNHQRALQSAM